MAKLLKIYKDGDSILRTTCRSVGKLEAWVLEFGASMWLTMEMANGVGLAANQVGYDYRIIAVKGPEFSGIMINPIITDRSKEIFHLQEGCLSLPGFGIDTGKRSKEITVTYMDLAGDQKILLTKDFTAVIIQHEADHLDGILFTDYLDKKMAGGTRPRDDH